MIQRGFCEFTVNGLRLRVARNSSVATALLNFPQASGSRLDSTPDSTPDTTQPASTPVCGMGTCWGCRATIDGIADRRSCLVTVGEGMVVETGRRDPRDGRFQSGELSGSPTELGRSRIES